VFTTAGAGKEGSKGRYCRDHSRRHLRERHWQGVVVLNDKSARWDNGSEGSVSMFHVLVSFVHVLGIS
jgi:hypothetical protein